MSDLLQTTSEIDIDIDKQHIITLCRQTNISNRHLTTKKLNPSKTNRPSTNKTEDTSKMNYSKMKKAELNAICKERKIKGITGKNKGELIEMIKQRDATPVPAPKMEAKTDVKVEPRVKVEMPTVPPMDKTERVKRLREHLALSKVNHEDQVMKLATLKDAHTYCVIHNVSAQQYGPLLERFIRTKFNYIKNKAEDCNGDCSKDGKNSEVKVSLGGSTHTKFNFVQIRPSHDCETYILTAYNLSSENVESEGELYIFKVSKEDIKKIVVSFGGYAHGTIKEHGKITIESLNDEKSTKEYALRPTINDACWKALMPFQIHESGL
jgi:hypothetical protein